MNDGCEALICLVGAHSDTFELLEFAEEILDQVTPFIHFGVDDERLGAAGMPGDDGRGAAFVEVGDDGVAVEGFVRDQRAKADPVEERGDADRVVTLARQQHEAHEIAERIRQRQDLCGHAAFGAADGLARSPPFAP